MRILCVFPTLLLNTPLLSPRAEPEEIQFFWEQCVEQGILRPAKEGDLQVSNVRIQTDGGSQLVASGQFDPAQVVALLRSFLPDDYDDATITELKRVNRIAQEQNHGKFRRTGASAISHLDSVVLFLLNKGVWHPSEVITAFSHDHGEERKRDKAFPSLPENQLPYLQPYTRAHIAYMQQLCRQKVPHAVGLISFPRPGQISPESYSSLSVESELTEILSTLPPQIRGPLLEKHLIRNHHWTQTLLHPDTPPDVAALGALAKAADRRDNILSFFGTQAYRQTLLSDIANKPKYLSPEYYLWYLYETRAVLVPLLRAVLPDSHRDFIRDLEDAVEQSFRDIAEFFTDAEVKTAYKQAFSAERDPLSLIEPYADSFSPRGSLRPNSDIMEAIKQKYPSPPAPASHSPSPRSSARAHS